MRFFSMRSNRNYWSILRFLSASAAFTAFRSNTRRASSIPLAAAAFTTHESFSRDLISRYDAFILDQFGVLHNGAEPLEGALECVSELKKAGKKLIILSNTSSPSEAALKKLVRLGFGSSNFIGAVTSGEEASKFVKATYGSECSSSSDTTSTKTVTSPSKVLFLTWDYKDLKSPRVTATPEQFFAHCGNIAPATSVDEADFVLFHGSEVWYKAQDDQVSLKSFIEDGLFHDVDPILERCRKRNLPAVCANPDFIVQTPEGRAAYMPGMLAQRYQDTLGGTCTTFGKPNAKHFNACIERLGLSKDRVAHVGDSLHHDIAGACGAGIPSIFVTSGIHQETFGTRYGELPDQESLETIMQQEIGTLRPTHVVPAFRFSN